MVGMGNFSTIHHFHISASNHDKIYLAKGLQGILGVLSMSTSH